MTDPNGLVAEMRITCEEEVVLARRKVRSIAREVGFSTLDETRLVAAASELGMNIVIHAGEGRMFIMRLAEGGRQGLEVHFEDGGPGIPDIRLAMTDGYSTSGAMGIGLKGAIRLVDDFHIDSIPGKGTTVVIRKWV